MPSKAAPTLSRPLWLGAVLVITVIDSIAGCAGRTRAAADRTDAGASSVGVECGEESCSTPEEMCIVCPEGPSCRAQPDRTSLPDTWTNGQLCTPQLPILSSAPQFDCDDDGDCPAGRYCVAEGERTFCVDAESLTPWDDCTGIRAYLCKTTDDCPPCASACAAFESLPTLSRCVTSP